MVREATDVPLRLLVQAGAQVALGADDPLLFNSRLLDQYGFARQMGFDDAQLAELAASSIRISRASDEVKARLLAGVQDWLATPAGGTSAPRPGP